MRLPIRKTWCAFT